MMIPYSGWTDDMKMAAIISLLEGGAREHYVSWQYEHINGPIRTWTDLADFLRYRYGRRFELQTLWDSFEALKCQTGREEQYIAECQRMFPRLMARNVGEALLCERFRAKVEDGHVRLQMICQTNPTCRKCTVSCRVLPPVEEQLDVRGVNSSRPLHEDNHDNSLASSGEGRKPKDSQMLRADKKNENFVGYAIVHTTSAETTQSGTDQDRIDHDHHEANFVRCRK